jgi:hypothetical protein
VSNVKSLPCDIIQILSPNSSASSKCWVLMIIDLPCLIYLMRSQTYLRESTSRPDVGSSSMMISEFPINAIPNDNFLFIPPDNSFTNLCLCSYSMTTLNVYPISLLTCYFSMSFNSHTNFKCSSAVNDSNRTSNCWQRPSDFLI